MGWIDPAVDQPAMVAVHADGGKCHGTPLDIDGRCLRCGLTPDMQSIELWAASLIVFNLWPSVVYADVLDAEHLDCDCDDC